MKILIVNGNYRSGTTWMQKILDNNERNVIIYQPFFELFKLFEEYIRKKKKIVLNKNFPTGILVYKNLKATLLKDKFLKKKYLLEIINEIIISNDKNRMKHINIKFYRVFKKKILKSNDILSFLEVFNELIESISTYRNIDKKKILYLGFKEGYLTSLLPILLKIKNCKIINMIRDPREITCSRNYSKKK